ncbi:hypothetical protein PoB_003959900 [Plakobranchus ocellatus]|uniref:Uncharacterized protein n=1 Tax=Plakobranchus ocellatus TaxID=259542 RepID=A0AAV4B3Z7_9GAST|nr:hypothetical protein PoB_003959900 [Plakobranchus ocellatus]
MTLFCLVLFDRSGAITVGDLNLLKRIISVNTVTAVITRCYATGGAEASPQQGDPRLSDAPSSLGASGGARTHDRRVRSDLRAYSLATTLPTLLAVIEKLFQCRLSRNIYLTKISLNHAIGQRDDPVVMATSACYLIYISQLLWRFCNPSRSPEVSTLHKLWHTSAIGPGGVRCIRSLSLMRKKITALVENVSY